MYDVIIIGLGPAGSTAAHYLAQKGHNVLGLEKLKMPRHKPCAGCISSRIKKIFDEDITTLSEKEIIKIIINFHGEGDIVINANEPVAYMVNRETFDYHLVMKAQAAGVTIKDAEGVKKIETFSDSYIVHTELEKYHCRYLIIADGVNGISSRLLGYERNKDTAWAFESEAMYDSPESVETENAARLDLGVIPYGYGWMFPKDGYWSFGVGSGKHLPKNPKSYYSQFLKEQNIDPSNITEKHKRGYRIPYFTGTKTKLTIGNSLLVGDAAGLVDPFLGEGIYYAIRSGQIAAETIHNALKSSIKNLFSYQNLIAEEIYQEFEYAKKISDFVYRFNKFAFLMFKLRPVAGEEFLQVLQGKISYYKFWMRLKEITKEGLLDFLRLLKTPQKEVEATYNNLAQYYDTGSFLWNQVIANSAWVYFEDLIQKLIPKNSEILDAGCGTGETTKLLLRFTNPGKIKSVDISQGMLDVAMEKIHDDRVEFEKADISHLPFADNSFDAVISTWAIETLPDPKEAVREFLRVIKEDGYVIYAFSSTPTKNLIKLYSSILEAFFGKTFKKHFLSKKQQPYHSCKNSMIASFGNGLMTVIVLRKCCTIADPLTPCLSTETDRLVEQITSNETNFDIVKKI